MSYRKSAAFRTALEAHGDAGTALPGGAGDGALRLAMQRSGRLTDETLSLLHSVGLSFESYGQRLFSGCRNFPLSLLYGRDDDIPEYVASGTVDLGMSGEPDLRGRGRGAAELLPLGFGYCKLVLAVPKESGITGPQSLAGAQSRHLVSPLRARYFAERGRAGRDRHPQRLRRGGARAGPGRRHRRTDRHRQHAAAARSADRSRPSSSSRPCWWPTRPPWTTRPSRANIDRLLMRAEARRKRARVHKYMMMNAPRAALPAIQAMTPGLKAPTIVPLSDPDWVAVHTVIHEDDVLGHHRAATRRASEILVTPIEKLLL